MKQNQNKTRQNKQTKLDKTNKQNPPKGHLQVSNKRKLLVKTAGVSSLSGFHGTLMLVF